MQDLSTDNYSKLLAPIYNWFTDRLDTAALQEAKVLLEELVKEQGPE